MTKYIPLLLPLIYYAIVAYTAIHFNSASWLLLFLIAPKVNTNLHIISSAGKETVTRTMENNFTDEKTSETFKSE